MVNQKIKIIRAVTVSQSVSFFMPVIEEMWRKGFEVVVVSSPGIELELLRNMGVKVWNIPMKRRISPLDDLKSLWHLIQVFRKEKPQMVHSMTPKAGLLCMLAAWLTRVPRRVHTFTGLVWPAAFGLSRKILMFTDWLTCTCATHIIPEGQGVEADLRRYITKKPMKVLGYGNVCGVDMVRFSRRPEVLCKANDLRKGKLFTFVFVGRLVGDKGVNELVVAFERLCHAYSNVRLILVGEQEVDLDSLKPETLRIIRENSLIEAVGAQFDDDLLAYYAASDCLVFPSYREGFPNVVLEAGAMGLPSIVTDINGSREIIVDGQNGLIIPVKDVNALYDAMECLLLDEEQTQRLAVRARSFIEARFEQSFVMDCLCKFYDEIL